MGGMGWFRHDEAAFSCRFCDGIRDYFNCPGCVISPKDAGSKASEEFSKRVCKTFRDLLDGMADFFTSTGRGCHTQSGIEIRSFVKAMRIAMISPPFVSVPPVAYGGTELVVH